MRIIIFIFTVFISIDMYGYSVSDFKSESGSFLGLENSMVKSAIPCYIDMKQNGSFPATNGFFWSAGLAFGTSISPFYAYSLPDSSDYKMFAGQTGIYDGSDEFIPSFFASGAVSLPYNLYSTLDLAFMPGLLIGEATNSNIKINANIYYRIMNEDDSWIGMLAGGGFTYTSGSIGRSLALSYSDAGGQASYNGGFCSSWNYNAADISVTVDKKLTSFFTAYGRAAYYYMCGSVTSGLNGSFSGNENIDETSTDNSPGQGLVLSGSMEFRLRALKFDFEAGRDWLSQSLYADGGISYGL